MVSYDVFIVGGGLVGSALALALAPQGYRIAMVEALSEQQRRESPSGERALALALGSVEIFKQLGVWQEVEQKATPIQQIHVSDRGHFGKTRLFAREYGLDAFGYVLKARWLESALMDACQRQPIDCFCPAQLVGINRQARFVEIDINQEGNWLNFQTRLLVAADGGHSKVREWAGIGEKSFDYGQTALVTTIRSQQSHQFGAFERFTESGPLALLPQDKRCSALIWTQAQQNAERLLEGSRQDFLAQLQDAFGWKLGKLTLESKLRAFPLRLIRAKRLFSERIALVGNAAHQLHPVAGQGLNLGLRDVAVLADLLRSARSHDSDPGGFLLLEKYANKRQADHDVIINFSHGLVRGFANSIMPLAAARNVGLVAMDHWPAAKRRLVEQAAGLKLESL